MTRRRRPPRRPETRADAVKAWLIVLLFTATVFLLIALANHPEPQP